jgi:hypothetical protein
MISGLDATWIITYSLIAPLPNEESHIALLPLIQETGGGFFGEGCIFRASGAAVEAVQSIVSDAAVTNDPYLRRLVSGFTFMRISGSEGSSIAFGAEYTARDLGGTTHQLTQIEAEEIEKIVFPIALMVKCDLS